MPKCWAVISSGGLTSRPRKGCRRVICKGVHAVVAVTRINSEVIGYSGPIHVHTFDYAKRALLLEL